MTILAKEISKELLGYLGRQDIDQSLVNFSGIPIDHKLRFPMDEIAAGVQATLGLIVEKMWHEVTGQHQEVTIDLFHSYLAFSGIFFVRQNGYDIPPWDPTYPTLGLYHTKDDRLMFINGGYPTLRDKILKVLDVPNDAKRVAEAMSSRDALELEEAFADAATCAAMVRSKDEWLEHPQGKILNEKPPIVVRKLVDSKPEPLPGGEMPLSGLKVVDLTQAIAGPAAGRFMAEFGAEVLHVSAPQLPTIPAFHMDTSHGKRQAFADFRRPEDLERFKELISEADVFIEGWRPNTMAKYGLSPEDIQKIRPGIVHLTVSCYGLEGPWKDRAGWEQLGQSVSGIIDSNYYMLPVGDKMVKTHLDTIHSHGLFVCDYLTGNFGAIAILDSLLRRHTEGGGYHTHIALTRNGMWVMSKSPTDHPERRPLSLPLKRHEYEHFLATSHGPFGKIEYLAPSIYMSRTQPRLVLPVSPKGSELLKWNKESQGIVDSMHFD